MCGGWIEFTFMGCVCIRFKCGWKLEKMKSRESEYGWEIAKEHHIYHLHAPARLHTHIDTSTHHHHHRMLKCNARTGCDNEYTRSYTFRCIQLSNSNWTNSVGATFPIVRLYGIFNQPSFCTHQTRTDVILNRRSNTRVHIMNQSIAGNATFLSHK